MDWRRQGLLGRAYELDLNLKNPLDKELIPVRNCLRSPKSPTPQFCADFKV